MRKTCAPIAQFITILSISCVLAARQDTAPPVKTPRPLELKDMLAWKSIRNTALSNDGEWMAYILAPAEGNSEAVLRGTKTAKETRFPIGEMPSRGRAAGGPRGMAPPSGGSTLSISDDSKWLSFLAWPTQKEAKTLRRRRRPVQSKVVLVNIATGEKTEFEKMRRFSFSGEMGGWIALQRYGAEAPGGASSGASATAAPGARPGASSAGRPSGSDLILHNLDTGEEINIGNVSDYAFNKNGQWLAWTVDASEKAGNGIEVRNMTSGAVHALDSGKAVYRRLSWTEKGDALAVLKGVEDKKFENERMSLVAVNFASGQPEKLVYDPSSDPGFPADMTISPNRSPMWAAGLDEVMFGIHELKKKEGQSGVGGNRSGADAAEEENASPPASIRADAEEKPDVVIWNWQDKRLQSMQEVQENADKNFSYLCGYRVAEKRFVRLADEKVRRVNFSPEYRYAIGTDNSEYELSGSLDGRNYQDVYAVDLKTGERTLALKRVRWFSGPSEDAARLLYYEDGNYFIYDVATRQSHNITRDVKTSFINTEDDHNVVKPPVRPIGWTKGGKSVLLCDNWDIWNVPAEKGPAVNLTVNGKKDRIRYQYPFRLDTEEKAFDLDKPLYVTAMAEETKQGGIVRLDPGKPGARRLLWGDASYGTLLKAKKAGTFLYTFETFDRFPDYRAADADLADGGRITDANPQQKDFLWSAGSRLIDYTSAKGDKLKAALFLPANYEAGKSYPTIVYIYEKLTNGYNRYTAPGLPGTGFNKSFYTSNGYAVLMPDIVFRVNDPGVASTGCITEAVKAAIATGIVDKDRVALHGHSWGGYQTAFAVTQTDIFKAAVAGAPLTNMISMYSSIYWNTGSANQPIFESSQGRFTGDPTEVSEAYERNSPVYFARNVKTPLVILHNDKDGAVDFNQGVTYYNALRRLGKQVVLLQYKGENHGLAKPANMKDYTVRMKEFFDHYLMGKPAPKWWKEGIDYLKIDEELKERNPKPEPPSNPAAKTAN